MTDAAQLLDQYHFSVLKDMVRLLNVAVNATHKKDYLLALASVLFTPPAIRKGLSQLGARERLALGAIREMGGHVKARRLRLYLLHQHVIRSSTNREYPHDPPYSRLIFAPEEQRSSFEAIVGRLMASGLVCGEGIDNPDFSLRAKIYYDNVENLYIPEQVRALLPALPTAARKSFQVESLTRVEESSARAFQRDLYFYWSTARVNSLSLTKQGRLYQRDLQLVNAALLRPQELEDRNELDLPRLIFLRRLLTDMGLLEQEGQQVKAVESSRFLGLQPAERIQQAFQHWLKGSFWNEILSISDITVAEAGTRLDPVPSAIVHARARVLDHLAQLHARSEGTAWVPFDALIAQVRAMDYEFLLPRDYRPVALPYYFSYYKYTPRRSPYISYGNEMGWNFSPPFEEEIEGWETVEGGFIRAILLEPIHWMGLADIGYADGRPAAYRLTPVGRWVLGVGPQVDIPEAEGRVVVQPNFEIFALDPISDLTLSKLDEFADRVSAERAIKYHLTRDSVYRAQRQGWVVGSIIHTLESMSDTPLPQNIVRSLEEWQSLHERITIHRRGKLLHAAEGALLDHLAQDAEIRAHLASRPDRAVALLAPQQGSEEELIRVLQERGYPPARTRCPADARRPNFTIDDNGQLHFAIPVPSIYLYQEIAPFTVQDERGTHFITQTAVESAIAKGIGVTEILSRLRALHIGPLPRWVEIKVRAWGHYYGDAALQTIHLVQIRDEATLRELLSEPELKDILQPFHPANKRALAAVSTADLNSLYEIFARHGISIVDRLE